MRTLRGQDSHLPPSTPLTGQPPELAAMCAASSPHGCHGPHTA